MSEYNNGMIDKRNSTKNSEFAEYTTNECCFGCIKYGSHKISIEESEQGEQDKLLEIDESHSEGRSTINFMQPITDNRRETKDQSFGGYKETPKDSRRGTVDEEYIRRVSKMHTRDRNPTTKL